MYHWCVCFHTRNYNLQLNRIKDEHCSSFRAILFQNDGFKLMIHSKKISAALNKYWKWNLEGNAGFCSERVSCEYKFKQMQRTFLRMWIQQVWQITNDRHLYGPGPMRIFLLFLLQWWTWLHRRQIPMGGREPRGQSHTASPGIINDIYHIITV